MAKQILNPNSVSPNDKLGDTPWDYTTKLNSNFDELYKSSVSIKQVVVNDTSDLPTAVLGVITLAADTVYLQANDIDLSTDRLVFSEKTVWSGIDTLVVTLSYVGTLPLFTLFNTSNSIKQLNILHPNSPLFSFSDSVGKVLRVVDVTNTGSSFGTFGGTNPAARFTNVSPILTSGGLTFTGNWATMIFEPSFAKITSGSLIDLGTATFDSISITQVSLNYTTGCFFMSGVIDSGNINTGGSAAVILSRLTGLGVPLSGITEDDTLWEFHHNDEIRDSRSDGLLSMQSNAVETIITTINVPVLVAGTWDIGTLSQMSGTTGGELTYIAGKDARLPITYSVTVEPTSGVNINISAYVAINGTVIPSSKRSGVASGGGATSITLPWQVTFALGDNTTVFVENNDTTSNILVSSAVSRVN